MGSDREKFEKMRAQLRGKGYKEKNVTISSGKAMTLGVLYALPFVIIFGLLYRFLLLERAHLSEIGGLSFYIMFLAILVVSVVIHELCMESVGQFQVVRDGMRSVLMSMQ